MNKNGFSQELSSALIKRAKANDIKAFEDIYRTYSSAAYTLALRICRDSMLAQDVVQNAFIRIMKVIKQYRGEGSFAGWIRRIIVNETINAVRQKKKIQLVTTEEVGELESRDLFDDNWLNSCRDLEYLLAKLSDEQRAVLLLHELEGYNHREIGKLYEKSESFSKVTLCRAYKKLKEIAKRQEVEYALNR